MSINIVVKYNKGGLIMGDERVQILLEQLRSVKSAEKTSKKRKYSKVKEQEVKITDHVDMSSSRKDFMVPLGFILEEV